MADHWSDIMAEQLRPKLCAEQVEWFSFAHLSAALRKAKADGMREAVNELQLALNEGRSAQVQVSLMRHRAARIERGEDA